MKHNALTSLLILLTAFSACAQEDTSAAQNAMLEWLAVIDAKRYQDSWEMTGAMFRNQVTAAQWAQAATAARAGLGELKARTVASANASSNLPNAPTGQYVIMQTRAEFDERTATETVTAVLEEGQWRVVGYYIR